MSTPPKLIKARLEQKLIMAEAQVEAFYAARKQFRSTDPIPARIEVLESSIKQMRTFLRAG